MPLQSRGMYLHHAGRTFEIRLEPIEPRPDEQWLYVEPLGHRYQWEWPDGRRVYQPNQPALLRTCGAMQHTSIIAGEEVRQLRYECLRCRAPVEPGLVGGTVQRVYLVDGEKVDAAEFRQLMTEAGLPPPNV